MVRPVMGRTTHRPMTERGEKCLAAFMLDTYPQVMADLARYASGMRPRDLTPLIDIVFLLLIFFLVATRFAQYFIGELGFMDRMQATMSGWDLLWFFLALGTAWRLASGSAARAAAEAPVDKTDDG